MNRRAFLTGLLASSALAPVVVPAPRWMLAASNVSPDGVGVFTSRFPWDVGGTRWRELWAALETDMLDGGTAFPELSDALA